MNVRHQLQLFGFVAGFALLVSPVLGQEPFSAEGIPPGSDYVYRKHYDQVQEILKTPDLAQREQKLEAYMGKLHADAKIRQYMESFFGQILGEYQSKGMNSQAQALTQKMTKWFPKSDSMLPQQFKSAYEGKDYAKAAELGERLRQKSPNDAQLLVMLAESYSAIKQQNKVLELAPKVVEVLGAKKAINYAIMLADSYRTKKDMARANQYYDMALQAYPGGPPPGWSANDWNGIKSAAYQVQASQAWTSGNYRGVIQAYGNLLQNDPTNENAYLFIGLSHWKLQELDQAQASFAKAVVLEKGNSAKARQYLEQIYKPLNNDSLDGIDQLLDKARAELNL